MTVPSGKEVAILVGVAATVTWGSLAYWMLADRRISLREKLFGKPKSAHSSDDSSMLPRDKLIGILKSCVIEADAAAKGVKKAYEAETNAAIQYSMMGRTPPQRTLLPSLFAALYARSADNILKVSGASEEQALAALQHWGGERRDREVRALERRVLGACPSEGVTGQQVIAALQATMDAEFELWQRAATEAAEDGLVPGTLEFSQLVRQRVASFESKAQQYLTDRIVSLGAPWTLQRAQVWDAILTYFVQTNADVQAAVEPATRAQERRVTALGVVGGMQPQEEGEGEMDPEMAAMMMGGGGMPGMMPRS